MLVDAPVSSFISKHTGHHDPQRSHKGVSEPSHERRRVVAEDRKEPGSDLRRLVRPWWFFVFFVFQDVAVDDRQLSSRATLGKSVAPSVNCQL